MDAETILTKIKNEPATTLGKILGFNRMTPLHDEWIKDMWDAPGTHAMQAYRGSFKTSSVIITGIIRYILFHPDARIGLFRKTFTDSANVLSAISSSFDHPEIRHIFRVCHGIDPVKVDDNTGRILFNFKRTTTPEANLQGYGMGGSITGTHLDVIVLDDIITMQDRVSEAEREKTKTYLDEVLTNIANPGALKIICGTPWHRDDAFKKIAEICDIKKYPIEKFNMLSREEEDEKRKSTSPFLWACNYSLEFISDTSLLFQNPAWGPFNREGWRSTAVSAHLDAAYGGSDSCALTILSGDNITGFIHRGNVQDWYYSIKGKYEEFHCRELLLEDNGDRGFLAAELRKIGINAVTYHESMNKELKISTVLYQAWPRLIWDEGTDPDYMNQCLDWRPGDRVHDDAPDSAASLIQRRGQKEEMDNSWQKKVVWY
ncbi:hypothetical protein AGMMS49587_16610 [Spirochaetia bacterium]|nr:hypothetical protein AGMMS49587_16610 [Spirochaetia bacterium]